MLKHAVLATVLLGVGAHMAAADCIQITDGLVVEGATWSPDGSTIAFDAGTDIYTVPAAGGPLTHVASDGNWPTWSPDGTRIAYARAVGSSPLDIWVQNLSGGPPIQITTWQGYDTYPDWSHDGDKIVYTSFRGDHVALYVYSFSTGMHTRLTTIDAGELRWGDWSPGDDRIVFERPSLPEGPDIFVVNYPSGEQQQLFGPYSGFRQPSWHPSGSSLLMIGRHEIGDNPCVVTYVLPSGPRQDLLCRLTSLTFPEWAPDGQRFCVVEAGNLMVCSMTTPVESETWGAVKHRFLGDGD